MNADQWVALIIGLGGGTALREVTKLIAGAWTGRNRQRRSEVDRMAGLLRASEDREEDASRRERIALEILSETRRVAIERGVPLADLPPVNLGRG